jgi:hypothetical protein
MKRLTNRAGAGTAATLALFLLTIALAGCGTDGPPSSTNANPDALTPPPKPPAAPAETAKRATPLATTTSSWPGVEARLLSARPRSGLLTVEIELANTGNAPVTIDHYSAADATMTDDASKQIIKVFAPPGGQPAATADLTQTLQPGESTTVNAAFPLASTAQLVTISVPQIGRFEAIPLKPTGTSGEPSDPAKRALQKAENRARAESAGRPAKKG